MTRTHYTQAERISDAAVHLTGLAMALGAVPVLIVVTALLRGDAASVTGVSIYGAALVMMIGASALYNVSEGFAWGEARAWLLQRLDHSAIFLKIAGTYTPFTLLSGEGLWLTSLVWLMAFTGIALKIISPTRFRWASLGLYLAMGWIALVAGGQIFAALQPPVALLIAIGGGLYTLGVVFYMWSRLPFHYTIWHVFVLAASIVFYAAVMTSVVLPNPVAAGQEAPLATALTAAG